VLLGDHRVAELVVLVVELDDRAGQGLTLGHAQARGDRAGGDVAHHDLERDDLDFLDQLLAQVQAADEVRLDADLVQASHDVLADPVVDDALALRIAFFCALNAVASSLKYWISVPGSGPSYRILALPS
jgi:hypothetical protein